MGGNGARVRKRHADGARRARMCTRQAPPITSIRRQQVRSPEYPEHLTANMSLGVNLLRDGRQRSRLSLRLDIENITDNLYVIAREGEFSPAQFASPRLVSATAKVRF